MEAEAIKYTTSGLDDFIFGIHLNKLEASSHMLRHLAQMIENSKCERIEFKHLPANIMSKSGPGYCEISVRVFDLRLKDIVNIITAEIRNQETYLN